MKVFSHTTLINISYYPGTSGSFLNFLFYLTVFPNTLDRIKKSIRISDVGSVHHSVNFLGILNKSVNYEGIVEVNPYYAHKAPCKFLTNEPRTADQEYMILHGHQTPNHELMFKMYSKAKSIFIQIDDNHSKLVYLNIFYKMFLQRCNELEMQFPNYGWEKSEYKNSFYRGEIDPRKATTDDIINYIKTHYEYKNFINHYPFSKDCVKPKDKNIFFILFEDMMFNRAKTFEFIETVIDKPISSASMEFYDNYIEKQKEFWNSLDPNIRVYCNI